MTEGCSNSKNSRGRWPRSLIFKYCIQSLNNSLVSLMNYCQVVNIISSRSVRDDRYFLVCVRIGSTYQWILRLTMSNQHRIKLVLHDSTFPHHFLDWFYCSEDASSFLLGLFMSITVAPKFGFGRWRRHRKILFEQKVIVGSVILAPK
jgi:hypothetical protein